MKQLVITVLLLTVANYCMASNPKIANYAVIPITQKDYPKLYAQYGAAKIKEINNLLPLVAEKVASSTECTKVELVELSMQRSSPNGDTIFFVDCINGKRFYVNKSELNKNEKIESQEKKMSFLSDRQATEDCDKSIKSQLANPLTFSKKLGSNSVYRAPTTGNVVVEYIFESKNNIGTSLPHKARCVFSDKGLEEAAISK